MKATISACLLTLIAVAGFAQSPADSPAASAVLAAKSPTKASCSISCGGGVTLSCPSGTTTCSAQDRNCGSLIRGSITCNGVTTSCPKTCNCSEVCVCSVPCSEECTSGGGFIQECGSWGICATSCACGGECLAPGSENPGVRHPGKTSAGGCQVPTDTESLRAAIFN